MGNADADSEVHRASVGKNKGMRLDTTANSFRRRDRAVAIHVLQHGDELFAAPAAEGIDRSQPLMDERGEGPQHLVARIVAIAIVQAFEVIEVHEEKGDPGIVPFRTCTFFGSSVQESPTVELTGQWVETGHVGQFLNHFHPP